MRQKTAISSLAWASLQARREFPNKIQGTRTTTKRKENERSETKKRWSSSTGRIDNGVCAAEGRGGGEEEEGESLLSVCALLSLKI